MRTVSKLTLVALLSCGLFFGVGGSAAGTVLACSKYGVVLTFNSQHKTFFTDYPPTNDFITIEFDLAEYRDTCTNKYWADASVREVGTKNPGTTTDAWVGVRFWCNGGYVGGQLRESYNWIGNQIDAQSPEAGGCWTSGRDNYNSYVSNYNYWNPPKVSIYLN